MSAEEISELEYDFLMDVLCEIDKIGKVTAARIITSQDTFSDFSKLDGVDLSRVKIKKVEKRREILDTLAQYDFSEPVKVLYTKKIVEGFLRSQYKKVQNLTLDNLYINVLLIKALGFTTAEETVEFYLYQRITRSAVTSWGQSAVESIARIAGAEKIPDTENVSVAGKKFDLKKVTDDLTYYIQVKSGPNTMNVGMVASLNDMIEKIEEKHPDSLGVLGMTYGDKEHISTQIKDNLSGFANRAFIGEEFWALLSGESKYYENLINLIDNLSQQYGQEFQTAFLDLVREKKTDLIQSWERKYGAIGEEGLAAFISQYLD